MKLDAGRYPPDRALPREPPQGDQQLACQRHNHGLAGLRRIFRARVKPLRQGAVLLEHQKPPCQLDHAAPDPRVTGSSQPFLATLLAALVRRAGETTIARHRSTVTQVSDE